MMKIFKHFKLRSLTFILIFLFLNNIFAQPIIFSSDQWPKRWERVMHYRPMNGYITPAKINNFKKVNQSRDDRYQWWGQHQTKQRYQRSRTPEYNYRLYNRYEAIPLNQRYAIPESFNYGAYPNYYGNVIPAYPVMYPNLGASSIGLPGMVSPYATPFYMAPSLYPRMGYPW